MRFYFAVLVCACSPVSQEHPVLTEDSPLHLEEHLQDATIEGSVAPEIAEEALEWGFDSPTHGWRPVATADGQLSKPVRGPLSVPSTTTHHSSQHRPQQSPLPEKPRRFVVSCCGVLSVVGDQRS